MLNGPSIDYSPLQPASGITLVDIAVLLDCYKELQSLCDTLEDGVVIPLHQGARFQQHFADDPFRSDVKRFSCHID